MTTQRLYLFVGLPGAGKTTVAKLICDRTGAEHLWADVERRAMFVKPTHSQTESHALYEHLNARTDQLLANGKSVVFDTNFNFFDDRQRLRDIAAKHGAATIILWIQTPHALAKQRAVHDQTLRNGYEYLMTETDFDRIQQHLQPPTADEHPVIIDASDIDSQQLYKTLGI